jgi:hypothetical protein
MSEQNEPFEENKSKPIKDSSESKQLKKQIRHQIEFYFSDSNL